MKLLTEEREARGWSRAELARRALMNGTTIGQIEAGRIIPYAGQLSKIVGALGFEGDPAALLEDVDHGRA